MIAPADQQQLLAIARGAIEAWLGLAGRPSTTGSASLDMHAGAFVTLRAGGELRGCIGHLEADQRVADVVASCAVSAASSDPRFAPLSPRELSGVRIEISVLHGFEAVHAASDVVIGRHGLLVERGARRGLLLPQVAPEWGWDAQTFVAHTCQKAGLPADAWPGGGATLYRFEADVFGEPDLMPAHP